jgi:EmrB/QacA subfamily drug resistance transporter
VSLPTGQAGLRAKAGPGEAPNFLLLLITVSLGTVVAPLNSTMLAVALPEIRDDFGVGHAGVGWLVSAYLISMAVAQPLGGRLGDQLGRARVFRFGLVLFLGFSIAAAFAPSFLLLIILRAGQALVGAAVIPNGTAMLRATVPERRLGQSIGITGSIVGVSAAVGPLLGSALLEAGSWRLLFLTNIPLVGLGLLSHALLRYRDVDRSARFQVDWLGAAALLVALVALTFLLGIVRGGAGILSYAGGLAAILTFGGVFLARQKSSRMPVAEWSLFRIRSYSAATIYILLSNLVMYTTLLAIPFFIKEVQHKGPGTSGSLLGAMAILMAVFSPFSGWLSDARGRRLPALIGGVLQFTAALLLFYGIAADVSAGYLAVSLAVLGLGMGIGFGAASTAAIESAPRQLAGAAAGTNSMMRYFGSIIGAGALGGILTTDSGVPDVAVFHLLFLLLTVIAAASTASAVFIHRFAHEQPGGADQPEPARAPGLSRRGA